MQLDLNPTEQGSVARARAFAATQVAARAPEWERQRIVSPETIRALCGADGQGTLKPDIATW